MALSQSLRGLLVGGDVAGGSEPLHDFALGTEYRNGA